MFKPPSMNQLAYEGLVTAMALPIGEDMSEFLLYLKHEVLERRECNRVNIGVEEDPEILMIEAYIEFLITIRSGFSMEGK